jgi:multiple sugar transport system substrate-binding protein
MVRHGAGLAIANGVVGLAGCGAEGQGPSATKKTGKLGMYLITNDPVSGPAYFNGTVLSRFQKDFPGVTIDATMAPYAEIVNKVNVETVAGTAPDVYQTDYVQIPIYSARGALKDLSDLAKKDARAMTNIANLLDLFREPDNRIFGLPATLTSTAVLYNKQLFDRYQVKYPDENLEWNPRDGGTFLKTAQQLTRPGEGLWGWWWSGQGTADTLSWLKQNNASWLDKTRTKADMLKPEALAAFDWMHAMIHKYTVSPKPQDAPLVDNARGGRHWLFLQGKVAMVYLLLGQESAWTKEQIDQSAGLVKVDVAVLPKGVKRASGTNSVPWHISSTAKEPELAWEFLKWWFNDLDSQVGVWETWRYGLPPSRKSWTDPRIAQPRNHPVANIKPFVDAFEKNYAVFHEVNPLWSDWYGIFNRHFSAALRGEQSMKIAVETAQPEIQALFDQKLPRK